MRCSDRIQHLEDAPVFVRIELGNPFGANRVNLQARAIFSGQEATRQAIKRQRAQLVFSKHRGLFRFKWLAMHQVVMVLQGDIGGQPVRGRNVERLLQPCAGVLRSGDVADFPIRDQPGIGAQGLGHRRFGFVAVRVIDIDVIRLQATKRVIASRQNIRG